MIDIPTNCPSCDTTLIRVKEQLFCPNKTGCGGALSKRILSHSQKRKIKGLGEATIVKLDLKSIHEIYRLDEDTLVTELGNALGSKLFSEIEQAKKVTIQDFIGSLSIPLVGLTTARKYITGADLDEIEYEEMTEKATENLEKWLIEESDNYMDLDLQFIVEEKIVQNLTICITGKLEGYTKDSFSRAFPEIKVVGTVSKNVDYLICDKPNGSTKEQKAESLNISVLTVAQLKEKL